MTEKKKTRRGRPKGAPNKPLMKLPKERINLTNNATVFEILAQANLIEDVDKQANGLRFYSERNGALRPVLKWAFDKNIKSTLPEGKTPYNPNSAPAPDLTESSLRLEFRKFRYFCTEEVPQTRREFMWIQLLEAVDAQEAEMIDLVKDKKWPFKNISKEAVKIAFPDLLP